MYRSTVPVPPYSAPVNFPLCQVPPGTDSVAWRKYCADTVAYWEKYDKTHK